MNTVPAYRIGRPAVKLPGEMWNHKRADLLATLFFAAHVPLAIAMYLLPRVATIHSLVVTAVILGLALRQNKSPQLVAYAAAYVAGSEVLWRMCYASTFWEIGKYAIAFSFVLVLVQLRHLKRHDLALLFFLLLMPSVLLTLFNGPEEIRWRREFLSFNLSGPFALGVSVWFFYNVHLTRTQFYRLICFMLAPLTGIATITVYATLTAAELNFTDNSNFVTSGGFGPNQVSAELGLGALLGVLYLLLGRPKKILGAALFLLTCLCTVQSAMTFSRGGLYCAGGALLLALFALVQDRGARSRLMWILPVAVVLAVFVIAPRLNDFTGGALGNRYSDPELTHRDSLVWTDIALWQQNFVFGVGPGMGRDIRGNSPHTEFSRMLAEHGLFGLGSLLVLVIMTVQSVRRAPTAWEKAIALSLVGWSLLFMLVYDMRVAAPSMFFGLSFVTFLKEPSSAVWRHPAGSFRAPTRPILATVRTRL
jgi:hypothetical protein